MFPRALYVLYPITNPSQEHVSLVVVVSILDVFGLDVLPSGVILHCITRRKIYCRSL